MAMMKYFPLDGNEIEYVEKQRKLLNFFPLCGNKLILQFLYLIFYLLFGSNMIIIMIVIMILIIYLFT